MKVALVGNMNNIHFSIFRYLLDLNVDAYLLMFKDTSEHFLPERDTWEIEKYEDRIITLNLSSTVKDVVFKSKSHIINELGGYDIYIGNGYTPAFFSRINIKLDVFVPYGILVEGLTKIKTSHYIKQFVLRIAYNLQVKGIKSSNVCITNNRETQQVLETIQVNYKSLGVPMVYNRDLEKGSTKRVSEYISQMKDINNIVILSHVSHIWKNTPKHWPKGGKGNDILIKGFARYIKEAEDDSKLFLFEYGNDVGESKNLIDMLGIRNSVIWLPLMSRKEIMLLLTHVTFGGGEFWGHIWGGTGWEFMAMGVPYFQYVSITPKEFEKDTGVPFPNIINTKSSEEICNYLLNYKKDNNEYAKNKASLSTWFDKYGGIGLAQEYKDIVLNIYKNK